MAILATALLWNAEAIGTAATVVSEPINIEKANAMALHVTAITGTAPDVTFTYSSSNSYDGTYTVPTSPAAIGANIGAVDVLDFAPEAARFIKISAENNSGANIATVTAQLAIQEL